MTRKIATLLTDFGTTDYFVGAMKGALLTVAPDAMVVDITHDIPPHDIHAGAWTLANAYACFPSSTVHVAVVDPGVGGRRRALAVRAGAHFFVAPDNGLLSFIYKRETIIEAVELTNPRFFRQPLSRTFHGRDVFAPIAAAILNGVGLGELGAEVKDHVELALPAAPYAVNYAGEDSLKACVIHVDRFGNLITNITPADLTHIGVDKRITLEIRGQRITCVREFFAAGSEGEVFAVWGSAGHLEIVARCASAAKLIGAEPGEQFIVQAEG